MLIGIDFDNTIVCYDQIFHRAALEQGLIPAEITVNKSSVRNYLRQCGRESDWTRLQGYVYGSRMKDVAPFAGVLEFFLHCRQRGIAAHIISLRTRYPFQGPAYDLHEAAHEWLESHGFYEPSGIGMVSQQVYFGLTKEDKLDRIASVGCTHFIDDLPEFFDELTFPAHVERILFDPNNSCPERLPFKCATSWQEIEEIIWHGV